MNSVIFLDKIIGKVIDKTGKLFNGWAYSFRLAEIKN